MEHNDLIAAARFMESAAYDKIGGAGGWDDPMLMIGVANLPTSFDFRSDPMTMKMVGVSQSIPLAGQRGQVAKAARYEAEVATHDRRSVQLNLIAAAKRAYHNFYFKVKALENIKSQRELMVQAVDAARTLQITNQGSAAELIAARAAVWRLEADIYSAEQEVDKAWIDIAVLMGREVNGGIPSPTAPPERDIPESVDGWLTEVGMKYPPLVRWMSLSASYAYSAQAMRRMRWPMLTLLLTYGIRENLAMENHSDMVGVQASFSLPLFSAGRQGNLARSMASMQKQAQAEYAQKRREVEGNIRTLHAQIVRLKKSVSLYHDRIIPADQDALQSAMAGLAADQVALSDVITLGLTLYRDRLREVEISLDLANTMAEVERYLIDPDKLRLP
jgi:outer membrane protein TolC